MSDEPRALTVRQAYQTGSGHMNRKGYSTHTHGRTDIFLDYVRRRGSSYDIVQHIHAVKKREEDE